MVSFSSIVLKFEVRVLFGIAKYLRDSDNFFKLPALSEIPVFCLNQFQGFIFRFFKELPTGLKSGPLKFKEFKTF